jgi:hypothetical protein
MKFALVVCPDDPDSEKKEWTYSYDDQVPGILTEHNITHHKLPFYEMGVFKMGYYRAYEVKLEPIGIVAEIVGATILRYREQNAIKRLLEDKINGIKCDIYNNYVIENVPLIGGDKTFLKCLRLGSNASIAHDKRNYPGQELVAVSHEFLCNSRVKDMTNNGQYMLAPSWIITPMQLENIYKGF